jgi:hypothetical protein
MSQNMMDKNGNAVMVLNGLGDDAVVRFKRLPEGVRISEIDVVKVVCEKNNIEAGKIHMI